MALGDNDADQSPALAELADFSVLWDATSRPVRPHPLDTLVSEDLRLPQLIEQITSSPSVRRDVESVLASPTSEAVRRSRTEITADFARNDALRSVVSNLRDRVAEIQTVGEREQDRDILKLVWRLGDLSLFVESLDTLRTTLDECGDGVESARLQELRALLHHLDSDAQVSRLRRELPQLREGLRDRRSVTVGINLDDRLRPREAVLLSVNEEEYRSGGVLDALGESLFGRDHSYRPRTTIRKNTAPGDWSGPARLSPLFEELDQLLRDVSRPLARALKRYNSVQLSWLRRLVEELSVFEAIAQLEVRLAAADLPTTTATISKDGRFEVEELYDPLLAVNRIGTDEASLVLNDQTLFADSPLAIVTGPNNGGKTTFVRAVGIAQLFGQAGLPVAARSATVLEQTNVVTHFAGGEGAEPVGGRFAQEAAQVASILSRCDERTLVLLNETFSSTGVSDALELSQELLEVIASRGARALFATHLHDVPQRVAALSLTIRPKNLFRVIQGVPDGRSLAREVAKEAGLDFDAL
ncbi:MAG: MutS-related protein [Alkalispirochaeta sp.]